MVGFTCLISGMSGRRLGISVSGLALKKTRQAALSLNGLNRSYSRRFACHASQISTASFSRSQNSGVVLKTRARRCAKSGVTERRSRKRSLIPRLETPSRTANCAGDKPAAGSVSSRKSSPGWVGLLRILFVRIITSTSLTPREARRNTTSPKNRSARSLRQE
jgi:hypothetical protein